MVATTTCGMPVCRSGDRSGERSLDLLDGLGDRGLGAEPLGHRRQVRPAELVVVVVARVALRRGHSLAHHREVVVGQHDPDRTDLVLRRGRDLADLHQEATVADDGDAGSGRVRELRADDGRGRETHGAHRERGMDPGRRVDHHLVEAPADAVPGIDEDLRARRRSLVDHPRECLRLHRNAVRCSLVRVGERREHRSQVGDELPSLRLLRLRGRVDLDRVRRLSKAPHERLRLADDSESDRIVAAEDRRILMELDERPVRRQVGAPGDAVEPRRELA